MAKADGDPLTEREREFVEYYLGECRLNASEAAVRSGYSEKSKGCLGYQLLQKPTIKAEIEARRAELLERLGVTTERVLQEYAALAFSDMREVSQWNGSVVAPKDSSTLDNRAAAAIAEVSSDEKGTKVKLHDKKGALDALSKHLGLFAAEKLDVTVGSLAERLLAARERTK